MQPTRWDLQHSTARRSSARMQLPRTLKQHGANLNAQDFIKRTPYRIAQGHKGGGMSFVSRPNTAELFEKLGADTSLGPHFNDTERELAEQRADAQQKR